jgi:hypothetical protein
VSSPVDLAIKTLRKWRIAIPEAVENAGYRYILTVEQAELFGGLVGRHFPIYILKQQFLSG